MAEVWKPSVTVAAVMQRGDRFCLVEEEADGRLVYNQPAGHWEPGETLADACAREALEETAHAFRPTHLLGVYRWHYAPQPRGTLPPLPGPLPPGERESERALRPDEGVTFLRFAFLGDVLEETGGPLDRGIRRVVWLTADEVRAVGARHRSPLVQACIDDCLGGRRYPLDLIRHHQ
jgi:8-oxo-dGTP pyrophosphatase MutT (NUDIX family)